MRGLSDEYGSWNTACNSRRYGRISPAPKPSMRRPRHSIVPEVASINLRIVLPVVDLPQPLSPTRPSVSPSAIWKLTLSTACTWPRTRQKTRPSLTGKCLVRFFTSSRAFTRSSDPCKSGRTPSRRPNAPRPCARAADTRGGSARWRTGSAARKCSTRRSSFSDGTIPGISASRLRARRPELRRAAEST